jgi:hypothetical protein
MDGCSLDMLRQLTNKQLEDVLVMQETKLKVCIRVEQTDYTLVKTISEFTEDRQEIHQKTRKTFSIKSLF